MRDDMVRKILDSFLLADISLHSNNEIMDTTISKLNALYKPKVDVVKLTEIIHQWTIYPTGRGMSWTFRGETSPIDLAHAIAQKADWLK